MTLSLPRTCQAATVAISPDTKDWTWVLERACPECGFDAQAFRREHVGGMVRDNAARWRDVLGRPDVQDRPNASTWSPLEYACHVRDVFRLYDERLRRMLDENDPLYDNWDQDETAVAERYDLQEPATVSAELEYAAQE